MTAPLTTVADLRCARSPSRARIATPGSASWPTPCARLRPATEPGEDRNDVVAGEVAKGAGAAAPGHRAGRGSQQAEVGAFGHWSVALRPATEPGEDRNASATAFSTSPTPGLRPATEPGEDRNERS